MIAKQSIRLAVSSVLQELGITDDLLASINMTTLQVEGRIATEIYAFFERLANGENVKLVETDMLDGFINNHTEIKYRAELVERVSKSLKLNVKTGGNWDSVLKFIERMERSKGQRIEDYAVWCSEDPFNSPKAHQIANRPNVIEDTWPQAFPDEVKQLTFIKSSSGGVDF